MVRDGKKTRFWLDVWLGDCPLKIVFSEIFEICNQQNWSVFEVLEQGDINLTFRRNFGDREMIEWEELLTMVANVSLSDEPDTVRWALEKSGELNTSSLYDEMTYTGITNNWIVNMWRAKLPLKIKVYGRFAMTEYNQQNNWLREIGQEG